jgi:hypothetical protein
MTFVLAFFGYCTWPHLWFTKGRVDRVGSLPQISEGLLINIGIPFLAHNYEQYQYRKVYSRAQKFEVLLGSPAFDATDIEEEEFGDKNEEQTLKTKLETPGRRWRAAAAAAGHIGSIAARPDSAVGRTWV